MYRKVAIIGDGAMGTVCGFILAGNGIEVRMWGHDAKHIDKIRENRENTIFLPGYKLPYNIELEAEDDKIFESCDLVVSAVPCQYNRSVWSRLKRYYQSGLPVVSVAKGIENETLLRPTQIIDEVLESPCELAVLSGPTIADELAKHLPASASVACEDDETGKKIQQAFSTEWFRVYTNKDRLGVELAGAMKNVIAIAAGAVDGTKAGDNAKAALLARGLAEITRLGIAMGAVEETFFGLSGLGDLVTTCISPKGRNRSFGERIGQGQSVEEAINATESVVEGYSTCKSIIGLVEKYGVEMPICQAVNAVLHEGLSIRQAILGLMTRELKSE